MGVAATGALVSQIDGPVPRLPPPPAAVPPLPPEPAPLVAAPDSPAAPPVILESLASSVVQPRSRLDASSAAPEIVFAEVVCLPCMGRLSLFLLVPLAASVRLAPPIKRDVVQPELHLRSQGNRHLQVPDVPWIDPVRVTIRRRLLIERIPRD
jgi:hypothetical protein